MAIPTSLICIKYIQLIWRAVSIHAWRTT
jgi:hypothetical protein